MFSFYQIKLFMNFALFVNYNFRQIPSRWRNRISAKKNGKVVYQLRRHNSLFRFATGIHWIEYFDTFPDISTEQKLHDLVVDDNYPQPKIMREWRRDMEIKKIVANC